MISRKIGNIFQYISSSCSLDNDSPFSHRHYAVGLRNGKPCTPILQNTHRLKVFGTIRGTMHAEMHVLCYIFNTQLKRRMVKKHEHIQIPMGKDMRRLSQFRILVFRKTPRGVRYSKPCVDCVSTMRRFGIGGVYYSNGEGGLCFERMVHLRTNHRCGLVSQIGLMYSNRKGTQ